MRDRVCLLGADLARGFVALDEGEFKKGAKEVNDTCVVVHTIVNKFLGLCFSAEQDSLETIDLWCCGPIFIDMQGLGQVLEPRL